MEMDTIGEDEMGLLTDSNQVVLPVEFMSENRTPYIFAQDPSVPGDQDLEGMELSSTHYYVPITLVDEHHQLAPNETAFLIDPTQLAFLASGGQVLKAIPGGAVQETAASEGDLLNSDASILKDTEFSLPDSGSLVDSISSNAISVPTISINGSSYQLNFPGVSELLIENPANIGDLEQPEAQSESENQPSKEISQQPITRIWPFDTNVNPPIRKGPFTCELCSRKFDLWSAFKKHMKCHLEDKPHRCKMCPATFNVATNLILHEATHDANNLKCPIKDCRKQFNRLASLKAHLSCHELEESLFCTECGDEFNNQMQLDKHTKEHYQEWIKPETKLYKCLHCERQYGKESVLKEHMKCHYKMKTSLGVRKHKKLRRGMLLHQCETCQKSFQKPSQLIRHKRIHTGEKPFKCDICSQAFNQKGSMKIHKLKHSGARPYQCEFCSAKFSQKGNLRAHVVRLHSIPRSEETYYECQSCSCVFRKISRLNAHMNRAHRGEDGVVTINKVDGNEINKISGKKSDFSVIDYLTAKDSSDKENDEGQKKTNVTSIKVNRIIHTARKFEEHQQNNELGEFRLESLAKSALVPVHECSHCSKTFKKPSDLVRHIRIHTREKPFKCDHCSRSFAVRSTLTTHMRTHNGDKHFWCTSCNKYFSTQASLKVHLKSHLREKRYLCKHCQESFSTLGERAMHIQNHHPPVTLSKTVPSSEPSDQNDHEEVLHQTVVLPEPLVLTESGLVQVISNSTATSENKSDDRPYKCLTCNAAFRKSDNLKIHNRIHTGEKPYQCNVCLRTFVTNAVLKAHMKAHLGIKSFKCEDCGKSFSSRSSLRRHMDTHAEGRPYICPYCSKSYKSKTTCRSHIKSHSTSAIAQMFQQQSLKDQEEADVDQNFMKDANNHEEQLNSDPTLETNGNVSEQKNSVDSMLISQNSYQIADEIEQGINVTEVAPTLHAVSSTGATIMISSLHSQEELTQESMREIEESLNQQLFSLSTDKEQSVNATTLFDQPFDQMVFSTITLPTDQMGLEQVLPTPANLGSILSEKDVQNSLDAVNVQLESEDVDSGVSISLEDKSGEDTDKMMDETNLISITSGKDNSFTLTTESPATSKPTCEVCDQTFNTVSQLRAHEKNHGKKKWYDCPLCGSSFTTPASLNRHTRAIHSDKKSFECASCGAAFRTESQLKRHNNDHHPSTGQLLSRRRVKSRRGEARQLTEEETSRLVEQLPLAGASVSERVLLASVAEKGTISELKCASNKFASSSTQVHRNRCKYCPKSFRKPSDLTRHLRTHTGERPYQCYCCFKSFTVKSTLDSHMKTHGTTKQFECHVCGSQFATKGSLKVHMRLHTGSRPFRCPFCDQRYRTSGHRKAHLEMHAKEANMKQNVANSQLLLQQHLQDQVQQLQNEEEQQSEQDNQTMEIIKAAETAGNSDNFLEILNQVAIDCGDNTPQAVVLITSRMNSVPSKPKGGLVCNICSKEFSKTSCLSRHMRIHTGEKPFKCDECGKMFNQKNAMQIHRQRHSGEKPWKCPECDFSLTQKGNLKTHLRRSHQFSPHTTALNKQQKVKSVFNLELDNVIGEIFSPESSGVSVAV